MKIDELFLHKYATSEDLNGKAVTGTIAGIASEKMWPNSQSPEVSKFVIYFTETKKGVVLSHILAKQITWIVGNDDTNWPGKRVTLYPEAVTVTGVNRVAIRAKASNGGAIDPALFPFGGVQHDNRNYPKPNNPRFSGGNQSGTVPGSAHKEPAHPAGLCS